MNCAVSAFSKSHPCFCCCSAYLQTADKTSWCGKTLSVVAGFRIHMQSKKKKEEEGEESVSMLRNVWVCVCVCGACLCVSARWLVCPHLWEWQSWCATLLWNILKWLAFRGLWEYEAKRDCVVSVSRLNGKEGEGRARKTAKRLNERAGKGRVRRWKGFRYNVREGEGKKTYKLLNEVNEVNDRGKLHTREWKQCAVEAKSVTCSAFHFVSLCGTIVTKNRVHINRSGSDLCYLKDKVVYL